MQLSIVIVNYNVKYFLEHCLRSVYTAIRNLDAEVIIVDNNSTDDSYPYISKLFGDVRFILNKENAGFAKACNQGVTIAAGRYILFLNPDTLIAEDSLERALQVFDIVPATGALGVRMFDGTGRFLKESKRGFPSLAASFFKLSGINRYFRGVRFFDHYYMGHLPAEEDHHVEVLCGAFMLVPRDVLLAVGGFDERFFMYGEDIDLSYRIVKAGYKNYYLASPPILHFKGESTSKNSAKYVKTFYQAMSLFVAKHYKGSRRKLLTVFIHCGIWGHAGLRLLALKIRPRRKVNVAQGNRPAIIAGNAAAAARIREITGAGTGSNYLVVSPDDPALVEKLRSHQNAVIYLSEPDMSYSKLIATVRQLRTATICFYSGTSIIQA